jgi:hypothetical protein
VLKQHKTRQQRLFIVFILVALAGCNASPETAEPISATRLTHTPVHTTIEASATIGASSPPVHTATSTITPTPVPPTRRATTTPTPPAIPTETPLALGIAIDDFRRPAGCFPPTDWPDDAPWQRCSGPELSPDGQWIAVLLGPDTCGAGLALLEQGTEELWGTDFLAVHWFSFLPDGRLLIAQGSCSNSEITLFDLQTQETRALGPTSERPMRNTPLDTTPQRVTTHPRPSLIGGPLFPRFTFCPFRIKISL